MRRTANIRVGELARFCTDPQEAEHLMKEAINWGLQQNKRTVRMIKLERLLRCGVGTVLRVGDLCCGGIGKFWGLYILGCGARARERAGMRARGRAGARVCGRGQQLAHE